MSLSKNCYFDIDFQKSGESAGDTGTGEDFTMDFLFRPPISIGRVAGWSFLSAYPDRDRPGPARRMTSWVGRFH